ncbi:caspase domain-containing protein [Rhizobium sp.]|uniref:caspase family protein n=1 Tax=Rhizobium sp. TaxID=391 RepID=UPI003899F8E6
MTSTAILIGNATYLSENDLPCCRDDVSAMKELLDATSRFDKVIDCIDLDADAMRDTVRNALPPEEERSEVFFYFSGHGAQFDGEFYYCGTKFDSRRPNETGVSHSELHGLFRTASPTTLVVVIDACYSGTPLVKRDISPPPLVKEGFRNVFQFSSSMNDQTSMGGVPLSDYTRAFIEASIRKTEGAIFYTDLSNNLRENFINNDGQTPFFVYQGTGRETLVDDARKLDDFRAQIASRLSGPETQSEVDAADEVSDNGSNSLIPAEPPTVMQLLLAAEEKIGSPTQTKELIGNLFDGLTSRIAATEFTELFETNVTERSQYDEPTIEEFMIRILSRERRSDRLVTAEIKRKKRKPNVFETMSAGILAAINQEYTEHFNLELNCSLERAQLSISLTPKFNTLQRLVLVLSCAPSLEHCYVFEMVTRHPRTDWDAFDTEGEEVVRRWYKLDWGSETGWLINKVCEGLMTAVKNHVEETTKRLAEG